MNLKRLEYFLAVAEEMNFGRAADRLNMAQPPLSRQIAQLEEELGARLFDRSRNQIRLTQAGETLLARTRALMATLEDVRLEVRRIGQGASGRLRIGFVGSATHSILPNIVKSYRAAFPDVSLSLWAMNNAQLRTAVIERQIDVAFARPSIEDPEIRSLEIHREPLILAAPDGTAFKSRGAVALKLLADRTFILYPETPRPSFADHVIDACRQNGFTPSARVFTMDYQTAISLVAVGVGVSLVPASVGSDPRTGVAFRKLQSPNPGTALSLNHRIDMREAHVVNFVKTAQKVARKAPQS